MSKRLQATSWADAEIPLSLQSALDERTAEEISEILAGVLGRVAGAAFEYTDSRGEFLGRTVGRIFEETEKAIRRRKAVRA